MKLSAAGLRLPLCMLKALPGNKWTFTTAAHLLNRDGFGGPPADIEKLLSLGPEAAVSHLVDYEKIPDSTRDPEWAKPDPDRAKTFRFGANGRAKLLRQRSIFGGKRSFP